MNKITKRQDGFTIIEVMIVLVIAAVILLIVFLAVPALQRNSRNTQRKNEVAALLAGATEYETNNDGKAPTTWDYTNQVITGGSGTNTVKVKLGFYDGTNATDVTVAKGTVTNAGEPARVVISTGVTCGTGGNATTTGASSRQIVALYTLEGSTTQKMCQDG